MKYSASLSLALFVVGLHMGCEDIGQPADNLNGQYTYTGYSLSGNPVVSGTLTIQRNDGTVVGEKNLAGQLPESGISSIHGQILESDVVRVVLSPSPTVTYIKGRQAT